MQISCELSEASFQSPYNFAEPSPSDLSSKFSSWTNNDFDFTYVWITTEVSFSEVNKNSTEILIPEIDKLTKIGPRDFFDSVNFLKL